MVVNAVCLVEDLGVSGSGGGEWRLLGDIRRVDGRG